MVGHPVQPVCDDLIHHRVWGMGKNCLTDPGRMGRQLATYLRREAHGLGGVDPRNKRNRWWRQDRQLDGFVQILSQFDGDLVERPDELDLRRTRVWDIPFERDTQLVVPSWRDPSDRTDIGECGDNP